MEYVFSPVNDFAKLEAAIAGLYGSTQAPRQTERYRGLLRGMEETFGPCERLAVFSAPGRTQIAGPSASRAKDSPWPRWTWTSWRRGRRR